MPGCDQQPRMQKLRRNSAEIAHGPEEAKQIAEDVGILGYLRACMHRALSRVLVAVVVLQTGRNARTMGDGQLRRCAADGH